MAKQKKVATVRTRMSVGLLRRILEALAGTTVPVTLYLPERSEFVSFDYGGRRTLRGFVRTPPEKVVFNEYESCYVFEFSPYRGQIDELMEGTDRIAVRVEDVITIA